MNASEANLDWTDALRAAGVKVHEVLFGDVGEGWYARVTYGNRWGRKKTGWIRVPNDLAQRAAACTDAELLGTLGLEMVAPYPADKLVDGTLPQELRA